MTAESSHPQGSLVVPTKVIPAFQGAILPREESSLVTKPVTLQGKLKYYAKKSSMIASSALITSSGGFILALEHLIPHPDPLTALITAGPLSLAMATGLAGFVVGLQSIADGSREYAPLPPSKKFLALEGQKREAVIVPFDQWDGIFRKNDARA